MHGIRYTLENGIRGVKELQDRFVPSEKNSNVDLSAWIVVAFGWEEQRLIGADGIDKSEVEKRRAVLKKLFSFFFFFF